MREPFEQAVARHGPAVMRVCRAVLRDPTDAEDAWSETFLSALRAWPDLPASTNVEAWLVRVAQRRCVDLIRRRSRTPLPVEELPERPSASGLPGAADGLWDEVAALPEKQRLAVAYHYLGGLPHAETAELTGSTPAAVRRAAADGVAALRRGRIERPAPTRIPSPEGADR
ncbi:sigma-70 family RNA polymerase sigma factor [Brachybacterium sp. NBEC-018]|nr:sigma-70 family RNA polymerase sigma factor [Brachybacterium sp. NBEC-018]UVY85722.1 sigma-70 family RNA polymerase sigma factor [Brachybacterium sp. NBEC-018]